MKYLKLLSAIQTLPGRMVLLLVTSAILFSCEVYHFEKPQPSDVESSYDVPKEFRGRWQDDPQETTVTLGAHSIKIEGFDSVKVVNRIASQTDTAWNRHYVKAITFNRKENRLDTITHYVIQGNKIYEIQKNGLSSGFSFRLKKDTIYFKKDIVIDFELNQKAFLRKLSETQYILNIHEENLWPLLEGRVGPWWQVILLEMRPDGKISFRDMDETVKENAHLIYTGGGDYFFDVSWTKSQILKLISIGLFGEGEDNLHRVSNNTPGKKK